MSIITSSGNSIPIDLEDEEIMNHVFDRSSCAKIIINQINNDRMYDPFLKDKKDLVILDIGANVGLLHYTHKTLHLKLFQLSQHLHIRIYLKRFVENTKMWNLLKLPSRIKMKM